MSALGLSALGFRARVGRGLHVTCSLRVTSGVTPANLLLASMAAKPFSSTYLQAGIGGARRFTD